MRDLVVDPPKSGADRILAVVVTYNPGEGLGALLDRLRSEAAILVVDNGSVNQAQVRAVVEAAGCAFLANEHNLGIARALNQGLEAARAEGADWLATFDQDSVAPKGALGKLIRTYHTHPTPERIAIVAMTRLDRGTGRDYTPNWCIIEQTPYWRQVKTTLTSGSLVRMTAAEKVGRFDDSLFIDAVDHIFCLKCRKAGFQIIETMSVKLSHSMGNAERRMLLGRHTTLTHHHPVRNYYMTRNHLELAARSFDHDFIYALRVIAQQFVSSIKSIVLERQRRTRAMRIFEGVRDFLLRRFGEYPRDRHSTR